MTRNICYFVGTHGDWGGASRILFNIIRNLDRSRFNPIVMLTREGPICPELEQRGITYHIWPNHDYRKPLTFAADIAKNAFFLKRGKIDLIHLNHGCIGWRPAELTAARILGIPILMHCQQPVIEPSPDLRNATLVLTCSDYLAQVSDTGTVPKRTVYDAVDLTRFGGGKSIRQELGLSEDHVILSFVGRTRRSKGLEMFINLAHSLPHPEARFLVTGQRVGSQTPDSYSEEEVQTLVAQDERVHYLGFRENIEDIYATTDIIVLPSQSDEACAAVLLETGASGKPLIATRTGSTPELVLDGENGFLVDREDLATMTERADQLIRSADLRRSIGRRARKMAEERFGHQPVTAVENIYVELIG